jgi:diguanylate cyclase (GGDEF)-like protein
VVSAHHSARRYRPPRAIWAVGAYIAAWAGWQLLRGGDAERNVLIGDALSAGFYCAASVVVWRVSRRCAETPRIRSAWRLIAVGLFFYFVAGVLQAYYQIAAVSKPYPSLADPAYLMLYPFALAGLLRFPGIGSRGQRVRALIGCAIVAIAGGAVVWYVVLGPATLAAGKPLQTLITIAYPVSDLVLIAGLATVLMRRTVPSSARALRFAAVGLVFFVAADLVYGSLSLSGSYSGGDPVDGLYLIAVGLFVVAARAQRRPNGPEELPQVATVPRTSWLSWLGVAVVFTLLVVADRNQPFVPVGGLLAAAVAVTLLVALRQLFTERELLTTHRELELALAELTALARTDPVTLLPNHRSLIASINQELARSRRLESGCAVVFLDVDHFKTLNDSLGHAAGDIALREFGAVARSSLRGIDTVGRWGGEEFVALLPDTGAAAAMVSTERLRRAIADHHFAGPANTRLTCSIGVAVYPDDGRTRAELIHAADQAMYSAKRSGRNQTFAAADPAVGHAWRRRCQRTRSEHHGRAADRRQRGDPALPSADQRHPRRGEQGNERALGG